MNSLIIVAPLSEYPSETVAFRNLTFYSKYRLFLPVVIETPPETKDSYFFFMKRKGLLDFTEEIITQAESEDGIRLDIEYNLSNTIVTDRINLNNWSDLGRKIQFLKNIN